MTRGRLGATLAGVTAVNVRTMQRRAHAFRIPLALITVAVLDHAFVSREPGTTTAGHLRSGLVPALVALALAWAYPRLRPGAQGAAALSCGVLALVAAGARWPAHSVTSIVAGIAGAWLAIEGARTLWRARRSGLHLASRVLAGVVAVLAVYLVLLPIAFAILATQRGRTTPEAGLGESITLTTADGLRLAGSYVPSRNRAAVLVFPGRTKTVPHARLLARHGYGVLLLDRRGEGASEGDINLYGWNGDADLRAAIAYLRDRPDVEASRIGGLGLSVGGELLLQAAAHDRGLRAVASEGAGVRSFAEHRHTPGLGRVQKWLSPWLVQTAALAVLGDGGPPPDLARLVRRIPPRRVLLIGTPDEVLNRVYAAQAGASLWEVERGGHTGALAADPSEYERRVVGFFDAALR
jgi:phosphate/sulfate permease